MKQYLGSEAGGGTECHYKIKGYTRRREIEWILHRDTSEEEVKKVEEGDGERKQPGWKGSG